MRRLSNSPFQYRFGLRGWAAVAVGLAILAAISFLAIGFVVLILPVVLLAPIFLRFLPKSKFYRVSSPVEKPPATEATVIEGDFKVISSAPDRNSDPKAT
jgi:hypothetical protein